ncbi:MAG: hypothetical protein ACFB03_03205 [Paracoccaceae bacterium]
MTLRNSFNALKERIEFVHDVCLELAPIFADFIESDFGQKYRFESNFALRSGIEGFFEIFKPMPNEQTQALSVEIHTDGRIVVDRTLGSDHTKTVLDFTPSEGTDQVSARLMGCIMDDIDGTPGGAFRMFVVDALALDTNPNPIRVLGS